MTRVTCILFLLISFNASAQYYYKDILVPRQTMEQLKKYRAANIRTINVMSYESNGQPTENFSGTQSITDNYTQINTKFQTPMAGESELTTTFDAKGNLLKSVDTTDGSGSVSEYFYNDKGLISKIINVSTSTGQQKEREEHNWSYDANGKPEKMLRIKNNSDTTFYTFVIDEKGNVVEENSRRKQTALPSYYYYHDDSNRLTDIVSYNVKAQRLLPLYIFEYNEQGMPVSMLVVPEGTDDYQKWQYQYNSSGLKTKETCYNKRKQVLGRIEYEYR